MSTPSLLKFTDVPSFSSTVVVVVVVVALGSGAGGGAGFSTGGGVGAGAGAVGSFFLQDISITATIPERRINFFIGSLVKLSTKVKENSLKRMSSAFLLDNAYLL
jgi:hypothetical protein